MKTKAIFYINIIAFTFLSGYMSSCTEKCYDHFIFFYHHGFIDRNHAIGIKDYEKDCDKSAFTDTIYMSRNLFDTINSEIQKSTETDTMVYDISFLMKKDNDILGIRNRGNECTWKVNQIIKNKLLSSKAIYLLRWKSGYYNYFTKDELFFFPEVRKYGLPKDYHMPSFDIKRITMYSKILVLIVD